MNNTCNMPRAEVMVNGKKRKLYGKKQNKLYLNDGDEFQIRLFNPLQERIGVALKLNGEYDSDKLLVLNPGQDFVLDRFLSDRKKFVFKTYEVNGNSEQVKEAIKKNGLVEIEFWNERKYNITPNTKTDWNIYTYYTPPPPPPPVYPTYPVYTNTPLVNTPGTTNININLNGPFDVSNISGCTYNSGVNGPSGTRGSSATSGKAGVSGTGGLPHFTNMSVQNSNSRSYATLTNTQGMGPLVGSTPGSSWAYDGVYYNASFLDETLNEKSKKIETGRIEEGGKSKQKFNEITFERGTVFHRVKYKLLPFSTLDEGKKKLQPSPNDNQMIFNNPSPNVVKSNNSYYSTNSRELRTYCPNIDCGYRIRSNSWRYCPLCSSRL